MSEFEVLPDKLEKLTKKKWLGIQNLEGRKLVTLYEIAYQLKRNGDILEARPR